MRYHVNLPISWIYSDEKWFRLFSGRKINPELGFDSQSLAYPNGWQREKAGHLKAAGLVCGAHLPFFGPPLGQKDRAEREKGVDILKLAAEVASLYEARHFIGHPSFFAHSDADRSKSHEGDIGPRPSGRWLENSVHGWEAVLKESDAFLYLENTHDSGPEAVTSLIEALWQEGYAHRVGMCFDIGHWFSFAQGCDRQNLHEWLDGIAPYVRHLHLHDNAGHADQHIGLGQGSIPLEAFFTSLIERKLFPTFTLEPHDLESFEHSSAWMRSNAVFLSWFEATGASHA